MTKNSNVLLTFLVSAQFSPASRLLIKHQQNNPNTNDVSGWPSYWLYNIEITVSCFHLFSLVLCSTEADVTVTHEDSQCGEKVIQGFNLMPTDIQRQTIIENTNIYCVDNGSYNGRKAPSVV